MLFSKLIEILQKGESNVKSYSLSDDPKILNAASLDKANKNQISFLEKGSYLLDKLDQSKSNLHAEHESFVTNMKWTMKSKDSMSFENTVMLDGEPTKNKATLKRVY